MKKIKISLILVIAIVGAFLIYKKFEHINYEQKEIEIDDGFNSNKAKLQIIEEPKKLILKPIKKF